MEEFERLLSIKAPFITDTCVQIGDYVYPVTFAPKNGEVSITANGPIIKWEPPVTEEQKKQYSVDNIIDLSSDKVKNMSGIIQEMDKLKNLESTRLSTINNVLEIPINEEDTVELKAIKEAINCKQIDSDSYKPKFPTESDFNNDMRALKSPSNNNISFFKAKRIMNAFDVDMYLTITDKPDSINPIGKEIHIKLTED